MGEVHVHPPHELEEGHGGTAGSAIERFLELAAVLLLSLTTLATAWSGYHAARWSGEQSQLYARANALHVQSQREGTAAGQSRIVDLLYFNGWLDAYGNGNQRLATVYRKRFRPEFVPAFRAWIASHPFLPDTGPARRAGPGAGIHRDGHERPTGSPCRGHGRPLSPFRLVTRWRAAQGLRPDHPPKRCFRLPLRQALIGSALADEAQAPIHTTPVRRPDRP